jgi:chlorobactene glucosyltransferase
MPLAFICFGVTAFIELSLWLPGLWKWRRYVASVTIILLGISTGLILGNHFQIWACLLFIISLYRIVNLLRLLEGRTQADYLFRVARRSSFILIASQVALLALAGLSRHYGVSNTIWWSLLAIGQLAAASIIFASTWRHLRTTLPPFVDASYADRDLPSLTVAIPARNETDDLELCLQSLIQSNYPKLEILVLDDCSQNRRTPEIIRSFAHDGIRFIAGKEPPLQWAPKNYAYQQLVEQANGELILFCGVDTRFEPDSLRRIVEILLIKHKTMLGLMPKNLAPTKRRFASLLVQPTRYAWELALPRRFLNRPPVLSTCWVITRQTLTSAGGFKAVSRNHTPESYFAKYAASHDDGYSFLQSDPSIGLTCAKTLTEQRSTAIRTRYPQTHRRPEVVMALSMLELAALVGPFGLFVGSIIANSWALAVISLVAAIGQVAAYSLVVQLTYRNFVPASLWLLPFATFSDIAVLNYSMWQYEFGQVEWKNRNICIPIMHVYTNLPKIDK